MNKNSIDMIHMNIKNSLFLMIATLSVLSANAEEWIGQTAAPLSSGKTAADVCLRLHP
jgi:hypothetical protein